MVTSADGVKYLLTYGAITAIQAIPGFVSYMASNSLLWLFFGYTQQRNRQISRRGKILNAYWAARRSEIERSKGKNKSD